MTVYNKESLLKDLKEMGIRPTDSLLVHASMKAIGQVEGGADTVVDALMESVCEGRLMMPMHTWKQMSKEYFVYDPKTEVGCVGIIPNIFSKREGVVRSLHPTHSMAVWGKDAAEYIKGEENCTTPCPPGGCWDRLRTIHAKILLLGVNHIKNTYIHSVEEGYKVPERLTEETTYFEIVMPDGSRKGVDMKRHYNRHTAHISESFQKLAGAYEECGVATNVKLGDANCILCDAQGIYDVTRKVLSHDINCIIEREEIPAEWWRD